MMFSKYKGVKGQGQVRNIFLESAKKHYYARPLIESLTFYRFWFDIPFFRYEQSSKAASGRIPKAANTLAAQLMFQVFRH